MLGILSWCLALEVLDLVSNSKRSASTSLESWDSQHERLTVVSMTGE